ncbi:assimilatory sulfite reductase (NADPH) flavoprotein subunit [Hymenobacter sp. GOD-10R]|uniref:assimilatory sulfite reductase (NADPH) flavoprotein subunit n=1 Tax=Hymenobacter sp. GOD-10R TaxID=3093922 RepID=UPI002D794AC7|nr:assimilatory sulfite reductase (NADPH) flavoprotein subunit [Hymenobacter sp. GOD-10R]WRQ27001.1 assimilatory sulfite reductase (NADPH) flavoprotein subunit [Hymenobacter sp. GOD-10R]
MTSLQGTTLPAGLDDATLQQLSGNLTEQQLLWLSGYFYGRYSATTGAAPQLTAAPAAAAVAPAPAPVPTITVLFGSQTGNSKKVAKQLADAATGKGLKVEVKDMNDYATRNLAQEKLMLVVVSTQGEGDPPVSAEELHQFLFSKRAPKLPELRYSVLALGDKSYVEFCKTGRDFDERFAELGAQRILDRVDCDVDYETAAEEWIAAVLDKITSEFAPASAPAAAAAPTASASAAVKAEPAATVYSRKHPWEARVLESIQLNGRGSSKETYHLELDLAESGLHYEPGDALAVVPVNEDPLVEEVLKAARLPEGESVDLGTERLPLAAALANRRELSVLTRDVMERYAALAPHAQLQDLLTDTKQLQPYLYGRDIADLLTDFPTELSAQALVETLRPLPSRAYSIASSLLAHPDEVHLTVGAVRYEAFGRRKQGACSTFLADRIAVDDTVKVFVEHNEYFKLPQNTDTDIIMVGAGTGVAPFRAFVEERVELGAAGRNWLFFGNPNFTTDFLYQTEWQQYLKQGKLNQLHVAFSRDQAEKIYVQNRLLENSKEVYGWLENGAHFYVCGDKVRLGAAIQTALTEVVQREAGISSDAATDYVRNLKKQRRYLEDVY